MDYNLIDVEAVAKLLGVTRQTLYNWRREGSGPPWIAVGRAIRYSRADLEAWLAAQTRNGSSGAT